MKVAVIGASGHVGFPFSLVLAKAGHDVIGIDSNFTAIRNIQAGVVPYLEDGAQDILTATLNYNLVFQNDYKGLEKFDVIAVMIGTPVDEEGNARLKDLFNLFDKVIGPAIKKSSNIPLVVLRSTVQPGTTEVLRTRLNQKFQLEESVDYHLAFCPERVAQGKAIVESYYLPQLCGVFGNLEANTHVKKMVSVLFDYNKYSPTWLTPREAEYAKLMTNMYRYINFAIANEFYMLANKEVDVHKVINAANKDYPRMNLAKPGGNVGGPCLFKDGKFLLGSTPYADLINVATLVNEGMPEYLLNEGIRKYTEKTTGFPESVAILGMTFKKGSDDIRNSLSFKLKKLCVNRGLEVTCYDPYWKASSSLNNWPNVGDIYHADLAIVMTPHPEFDDIKAGPYQVLLNPWKGNE